MGLIGRHGTPWRTGLSECLAATSLMANRRIMSKTLSQPQNVHTEEENPTFTSLLETWNTHNGTLLFYRGTPFPKTNKTESPVSRPGDMPIPPLPTHVSSNATAHSLSRVLCDSSLGSRLPTETCGPFLWLFKYKRKYNERRVSTHSLIPFSSWQ